MSASSAPTAVSPAGETGAGHEHPVVGGRGTLRRDIEGLRAIAVLLVLLLHAGLPPRGGFVGVDIFFVISGYLMTRLLVAELSSTGDISLLGFYARRAKRLLPAAGTVLVFTAVATLLWVPKIRWNDIGRDIVASALYFQNWRLAHVSTNYDAQGLAKSPLQHFWSLAVEEQFYLLWPVLLLVATAWIRRRPAARGLQTAGTTACLLAAVVVLIAPSLYWSAHLTAVQPNAAYFATSTRLWELGLGGAVAIVASHHRVWLDHARLCSRLAPFVGWVGLLAIAVAAVAISADTPFPGTAALLPTLGTAAVILAGEVPTDTGPTLLLRWRPFQWVGKLSYSLYLWHWPLLVIAAAHWGNLSTLQSSLVVLASAVPAYLSFRLIEDPLRRRRRLSEEPGQALVVGACFTAAGVVASAVVIGSTWPPPAPPAPLAIFLGPATGTSAGDTQPQIGALTLHKPGDGAPTDTSASITPDPLIARQDIASPSCITTESQETPHNCLFGSLSSPVRVALVGDSHAAQLIAPMDAIATQRGWRMSVFAKQACTFMSGPQALRDDGTPYPQCDAWNREVQSQLVAARPDLVVEIMVQRNVMEGGRKLDAETSAPVLKEAYERSWAPLLAAGVQVVVIKDTPDPPFDVPTCVSEHTAHLTSCAFDRSKGVETGTALADAARETPGVTLVDLNQHICPTQQCAPVIGGVLVYRDDSHVTATYAKTLAPALNQLLPQP